MTSSTFSPFNNFPNATQLRQPRGIVVINDMTLLWMEIEVTTTTFYIADSYRITMPIKGQPVGFNLAYLASQVPLTVKIYVGFPSNPDSYQTSELDLIMVGDVDKMDVNPLNQTVTFSGRDLTSRLIDTKTYAKYPNQTASSIATMLAQEHGLTPVVTPTTEKAGIFYKYYNTLMSKETTEWDLLCSLAQAQPERFVVFIEPNRNQISSLSTNLVFAPQATIRTSNPYILIYNPETATFGSPTFYGTNLVFSRSLTLAQDVVVKIRVPYSPQTGRAFTVQAKSRKARLTNPQTKQYYYIMPGLSKDQAQNRANQLVRDITIHEMRLEVTLPGDTLIQKNGIVEIRGTQSNFDQIYYADSIVRTLNYNSFLQRVSAKNHDTTSEIVI